MGGTWGHGQERAPAECARSLLSRNVLGSNGAVLIAGLMNHWSISALGSRNHCHSILFPITFRVDGVNMGTWTEVLALSTVPNKQWGGTHCLSN